MKRRLNRRDFVRSSAAVGITAGMAGDLSLTAFSQSKPSRPVVLASNTTSSAAATASRLRVTEKAMEMIRAGRDTLDAVIAGVSIVEDDPNDMSVGYGGLPNEEGEVELDASVMHGPTRRAGAVGALKHIKNPSKVAKLIMERTDHLLLVGEGALRFALAHGFKKEDLLTDEARTIWARWKETRSDQDGWGPGLAAPDSSPTGMNSNIDPKQAALLALADKMIADPPTGTISCLAINERGDLSGVTTTSGLGFKIAGRVGDSPLIGGGLFVDNEVGAAGSTGRGEECIKICGSHTVVEMMRHGASPTGACLEAIKRTAGIYKGDKRKLSKFSMIFYAINKAGDYGAAGLWGSRVIDGQLRRLQYVVHDGRENKLRDIAYLYESPDK